MTVDKLVESSLEGDYSQISSDREIHEKLKAVGFRLHYGPEGAGAMPMFLRRGGGYYVSECSYDLMCLCWLLTIHQTPVPASLSRIRR